MRFLRLLTVLTIASAAFGGEFAVLTNGSRLLIDRHEVDGARIRLYTGSGHIEMDAVGIQAFEIEGDTAPAPPPLPAAAPAEPAKPAPTPTDLADAAAIKYGLPRNLLRSVMSAESAGKTSAVSPKGAIGLMQLMPGTAKDLGVDAQDPEQNVDGGARYLRDLLLKYDGRLRQALAAYNAGPGAVQKYNDVPPYRETINYVNRIDNAFRKSPE